MTHALRMRRGLMCCCLLSLTTTISLLAQEKPHFTTVGPLVKPGVTVNVVNAPGAGGKASAPSAGNAQKVHLDPATGRIKQPDAEESARLNEQVKAMIGEPQVNNLQPVYHQNGAISVDLQGSFLEFATATIGKDGKLVLSCEKGDGKSPKSVGAAISKSPKAEVSDVR